MKYSLVGLKPTGVAAANITFAVILVVVISFGRQKVGLIGGAALFMLGALLGGAMIARANRRAESASFGVALLLSCGFMAVAFGAVALIR